MTIMCICVYVYVYFNIFSVHFLCSLQSATILIKSYFFFLSADMMSVGRNIAQELLGSFPGIDEAMSFAEVMK